MITLPRMEHVFSQGKHCSKNVRIVYTMPRIVKMDSYRLFRSMACVRMSDLPGCWHLFTHKGAFRMDMLANELAGQVTFGPVHTSAQNFLHSMEIALCTLFSSIVIYVQ